MDNEYIPGSRVSYGDDVGTVVKVERERDGSLDCLIEWDDNSPPSWIGANQLEPAAL